MNYCRLKRPKDFRVVYNNGNLKFGQYVAVHTLPINSDKLYVGISVSKKVGNAVIRNAVKRKLREIINYFAPYINHGYCIVIGTKVSSRTANYHELKKDIFNILQGLGLIRRIKS